MLKQINLLLFLAIFVLSSCSKKTIDIVGKINKESYKTIFRSHLDGFKKGIESYSLNSQLSYKNGKNKKSVNSVINFYQGKQINASLSYFGFNVAKVSLDKQDILFYEKITKSYFDSDYEHVYNAELFNFKSIEKLLSGQFFLPLELLSVTNSKIENETYKLDFNFKKQLVFKSIKSDNSINLKNGTALFDSNFHLLQIILKSEQEQDIVRIRYEEWSSESPRLYPKFIKITSDLNDNELTIKNRSLTENKKPFKKNQVPSGYKRINLFDLLNI